MGTKTLEPLSLRYQRRQFSAPRREPVEAARRWFLVALTVGIIAASMLAALVMQQYSNRLTAVPAPAFSGALFPCPAPVDRPLPGQFSRQQYPPLVVWDGRDYAITGSEGTPAQRLGTITCNIQAISDFANAYVPRPWPDGSSTAAAEGAVVRGQQGVDTACEITVQMGSRWVLFRSRDC